MTIRVLMFWVAAIGGVMTASADGSDSRKAGREFYYNSVLPQLAQNGCPSCHAVGYIHPNVTVYEDALRRLAIGDSRTNNAIIYKIANVRSIAPDRPEHPGGQRCKTIDSEPCATIQKWWLIEFGNASGTEPKEHP